MVLVVSDTSPIRALAHLGMLNLLQALFAEVLVPPAVRHELRHPPPGLPAIDLSPLAFIKVQTPQNQAQVLQFRRQLDVGEAEALALAVEVHASVLRLANE
jgi:predicted nucleic acid-binding protein